ncbi:hypothetical protein Ndes2526B_g07598 [Nannochloris sp. 'desiccata']
MRGTGCSPGALRCSSCCHENDKPEREGSRSPVKARPKEYPSPLPPSVLGAEPETEEVAPQIKADAVFEIATPSKPSYVISEGDAAFGKSSTVHFSTKNGCFVSAPAPVPAEAAEDYSEDTPSSKPDAGILEKLEKERRNRQHQISAGFDATAAAPYNTTATEKLRNNLSFIDRAVQTSHWPAKERGTSAQSQALEDASGSCSAWEIYDAYLPPGTIPLATPRAPSATGSSAPLTIDDGSTRLSPSREDVYHCITRVMQRMLYQNINPDISADFKFWEDPADAVRPDEGTLLPLWHFEPTTTTKGRSVTALAWNPKHPTLFAAGYGSFDPGQPFNGIVCCHTLSDAGQPECEVPLSSSVLSLAFHPTLTYLLAIGCLDGSVHVIDISNVANPRIKASCSVAERHREAVWQVRWIPAAVAGPLPLRFQAVSSDGSLVTWELEASKELYLSEKIHLPKRKSTASSGGDTASSTSTSNFADLSLFSKETGTIADGSASSYTCAAVSSMDTHPTHPSTVLIGTQEGDALRYCLDIGVEHGCTDVYSGHGSSIYTAQWNPFHPTMFLTASADWTVRIWDSTAPQHAVLVFDLGGPVGDAAWSPTSSTVFAAATESGRVLVYDLAHSMDWPLCKQKVTQKVKLTKLAFSSTAPVLLVGDEKGGITCFKLSPNLRKPPQPPSSKGSTAAGAGRVGERRRPAPPTQHSGDSLSSSSSATSAASTEETSEEKARKATALQREHLNKVITVASACRAAEADWVYVPRPIASPSRI